jgi:hypothetical protein
MLTDDEFPDAFRPARWVTTEEVAARPMLKNPYSSGASVTVIASSAHAGS